MTTTPISEEVADHCVAVLADRLGVPRDEVRRRFEEAAAQIADRLHPDDEDNDA